MRIHILALAASGALALPAPAFARMGAMGMASIGPSSVNQIRNHLQEDGACPRPCEEGHGPQLQDPRDQG